MIKLAMSLIVGTSLNILQQRMFYFLFVINLLNLCSTSPTESLSVYDDVDADIMRNYQEFTLAAMLVYGMKEQSCSEQSARMTAMDGASKNAGMYAK